MLTISNDDGFTQKYIQRVNKERGLRYNQVGNKRRKIRNTQRLEW